MTTWSYLSAVFGAAGLAPRRASARRWVIHSPQLTKRQCEIVLLAADGHNRESIAHQLGISLETVIRHLSNIFEKMHVNSQREVVSWYYRTYWVPNPEMKLVGVRKQHVRIH